MNLASSLTNRIFLASALLVLTAIGLAIYRVNVSVAAQAETDLGSGLADAAALVDQLTRAQFEDFVVKGSLIADLPVLKGAAATNHAPTVQPIAEDYQQRIGADVFVVVGTGDRVLARAGRVRPDDREVLAMLEACRRAPDASAFWPAGGGIIHAAAMPLEAGTVGTLIVGLSLDQDAAVRLKAVTQSDIAFLDGSQVVAATLAPGSDGLSGLTPDAAVFTRDLDGDTYIGRIQALGRSGEPLAVVLRSRTEHLRFLPRLHWQIALTGLAAVAVATVLGYAIARTVTRPLRALTATMGEMATTGDLTRPVPAAGRWDDEDARLLSSTFRQLTGALGRFQREAAQRERLSSLGRLSTVVAHEVRNPLMIIKSTVRSLRRHEVPDVSQAADSIDEEVRRLDRVVTGVLDFARPIHFDLSPADLATVCHDACKAAVVSDNRVPVIVEADASPAPVRTDVERLRAVLVNLVTNAQQAVQARADGRTPPVRVRLAPAGRDRWRVEIVDEGVGIAAEHLPRLFEPFFTTRRTGSGLGLALARSTLEGLGGTITITSQPGAGTTVRLDLPNQRSAEEARS